MNWVEIKVYTASEAVEAISALLMEMGAGGVAIEDSKDLANFQEGLYGEWLEKDKVDFSEEEATVTAYFPKDWHVPEQLSMMKEKIANLRDFGLDIGKNEIQVSDVAEEEWENAWKKHYHPVRVTRFLTIVPSWEEYVPVSADERMIRMDPGMAFGTGTHPTTRLSLQALEIILQGGEVVLDVGTGSGVLSIASSLLGAESVYAYDLDQVAVRVAQENIMLNESAKNIHIQQADLLKEVTQEADVIVANILADIIVLMVKDAYRLLKPEGYFVISGIIEDKYEQILESIDSVGFVIDQEFRQKEWVTLILKKLA